MNVIGIIGQWIIDYQEIIEIILLSVLALIILIAVISAFARAQKRRSMLEDISSRVGNIQETVTSIQEEQRLQHPEPAPVAVSAPVAVPCPPPPAVSVAPEVASSPSVQEAADGSVAPAIPVAPAMGSSSAAPPLWPSAEATVLQEPQAVTADQASAVTSPRQASEGQALSEPEPTPTKYVSRDWGIDKFGRSYTEEELTQQIR